jgi:hypothetical protein
MFINSLRSSVFKIQEKRMEPCFLVSLDMDSFLLLDPDPNGYHNKDLFQRTFQSLILNINVLMFS